MTTVIIGAGAAGIAAAAALESLGKDYVVLEARDRIGGRVYTLDSGEELGGAWLHECPQNPLEKVARHHGIKTEFDDDRTRMIDLEGNVPGPELLAMGPKFAEWLHDKPETSLMEAATVFAGTLETPEQRKAMFGITQVKQLPNGTPWELLSSKLAAHPEIQLRDKAVIGGYRKLLEAICPPSFESHLQTDSPVVSVTKTEDGIEVATAKNTYRAENVICTLPIGVLKAGSVKFSPPLNPKLERALAMTDVAAIGKVYLGFRTHFWSYNVFKYIVLAETPALVWSWGAVHPEFAKYPTLCVIVCNDVIRQIEADPSKAFALVKPYLVAIAEPQFNVPDPISLKITRWISDEYSLGGYSTYHKGNSREEAVEAFDEGDYDDHLLFAGEHATPVGATYIHGAYLSGQKAAEKVVSSQR